MNADVNFDIMMGTIYNREIKTINAFIKVNYQQINILLI